MQQITALIHQHSVIGSLRLSGGVWTVAVTSQLMLVFCCHL